MPLSASSLLNRFTLRTKFRHMQILVALAEFGSMRRAAQHLGMTQPAISQMVAELERLVEADLFLRHARGVRLTPAGQALAPAAQRILSTLGDAAERMTNEIQQKGGFVRLTASPAAAGALLHTRLAGFAQCHPDTQLQITQAPDEHALSDAMETATDLICLRAPGVTPEGWCFEPCRTDRLVVVCHHSHPLAGKTTVGFDDLAACSWMMHRVGSVARTRLEAVAEAQGWPELKLCQIKLHIPDLTRDILAGGHSLAFLPEAVLRPWIMTGEFVVLDTPMSEPLAPLGFLWRPDRAQPAVHQVAAFLKDGGEDPQYRFAPRAAPRRSCRIWAC